MSQKLQLNLGSLKVETFGTAGIPNWRDGVLASQYPKLPQAPSTSPCLNSEQTCDSRCWA